jgi:DNA-binding SARP family transcriptional activator
VSVGLRFVASLVALLVSLAVLAGLWRLWPGWPTVPRSVSSPITTEFIEQLVLVAAWLVAGFVVLLLVVHGSGAIRARGPRSIKLPDLGRVREPAGLIRRIPRTLRRPLLIDPPLLVVALPPEEATKRPDEYGDRTAGTPAARAVATADSRPLVCLLGPLTIHGGQRSIRGLRAHALELIAFLALRREGAQRDEILEAVWPGEDPKRSRHRLYQAVRDARRLLGDAVASERDRYWLDRKRVRVDVDELDDLLERAARAGSEERKKLLESALTLCRAEPLAGCDYVWSDGELRRIRATYAELLKCVGRAHLEAGDARKSLQAAERGLAIDALDEDLWRLAFEAEGALGLREAIEKRYGQLREVLQTRLALEPAKEPRALYLRLLGQS